jgi:hypothetical protein
LQSFKSERFMPESFLNEPTARFAGWGDSAGAGKRRL